MNPIQPLDSNPFFSRPIPILLALAALGGVLAGLLLTPAVLPGPVASLIGSSPKAYWFLARGSALVAFGLLWMAMALGMSITNRMARVWPGGPLVFDLHQFLSLLGLGFAIFHGLVLLGDRYIGFSLTQILVPFAAASYKPFWVGLGQLGIYLWAVVVASFYLRKQIGRVAWRLIHFVTYLSFAAALVHGLMSGTDSSGLGVLALYWLAGGSTFFLLVYRILVSKSSVSLLQVNEK